MTETCYVMPPMLLSVRTWIWNATLRRPASLILAVVCFVIISFILLRLRYHIAPLQEDVNWEEEYEKERISSVKEHASFYVGARSAMEPVPLEWTARDRCPACFGTELCAAIERKEVVVKIPKTPTPASKKGVYFGHYLDLPVAVKRLTNYYPEEFRLFDEFICKNATGSKTCNVSSAIVRNQSYVQNDATFSPENMLRAWKISYPQSDATALKYAMCIRPQFMKIFRGFYDDNDDDVLTPDQKAMLFTAMVVQPESLMLKFLRGIQFQRVAPKVHGTCGRLVVMEHGGQPLTSYLDELFVDRAELAMQLLSMVQVFWHADRRWFALYKDFVFENIAVTHDNDIFILDYEELSIIENTDFNEATDEDRHEGHTYGHNMTCNDDCFNQLFETLSSDKLSSQQRKNHCDSLHSIAGALMYSTLCRNILSDLPEHRAVADKGGPSYRGLLHNIPKHPEEKNMPKKIMTALRECVLEREPGGRVKAANSLADLLTAFVRLPE